MKKEMPSQWTVLCTHGTLYQRAEALYNTTAHSRMIYLLRLSRPILHSETCASFVGIPHITSERTDALSLTIMLFLFYGFACWGPDNALSCQLIVLLTKIIRTGTQRLCVSVAQWLGVALAMTLFFSQLLQPHQGLSSKRCVPHWHAVRVLSSVGNCTSPDVAVA